MSDAGATPARTQETLAASAAEMLRANDLGGWTRAAPRLYPHQWSWDSAFIAIGLRHLDTRRAAQELETLFAAQWANGKVPHIVFNPAAADYAPGPDWWAAALSPDAPAGAKTSGLCQPPVHAVAARQVYETANERGGDEAAAAAFLRGLYPRLLAWHRFLATARDPEDSGLVTIYHPWEGTDNSPRWDAALATLAIGELSPFARSDVERVRDAAQRPTNAEYDRYRWLVDLLKGVRYDEAATYRSHPFLIKDVLFSAIFVAANEALLEIAATVGAPDEDRATIAAWRDRGRRGLDERWDADLGLCLDYDLRAGAAIRTRTSAGFAPLIAGGVAPERERALLATLDSPAWLGHPRLRWPVPPSVSPDDPTFEPRRYWRGPTWPVMNWLYWWALRRLGESARAERLRRASLDQLLSGGLAEYFEPFTGESLGALEQSWTAAFALDWMNASAERGTRSAE